MAKKNALIHLNTKQMAELIKKGMSARGYKKWEISNHEEGVEEGIEREWV